MLTRSRYVEMLEQQQAQLVAGMHDLYHKVLGANCWPGAPLQESEGHPLTHDILAALRIINTKPGGQIDMFEEDPELLQQRLLASGASFMTRRGSVSSESESSHTQGHARSKSHSELPILPPSKALFKENFGFQHSGSSSPVSRSPVSHAVQPHVIKPSPLHNESPVQDNASSIEDNNLMSWQDLNSFGNAVANQSFLDSQFQLQLPVKAEWTQPSFNGWQGFDAPLQYDDMQTFPEQITPHVDFRDWQNEAMDLDYNNFIQVTTYSEGGTEGEKVGFGRGSLHGDRTVQT